MTDDNLTNGRQFRPNAGLQVFGDEERVVQRRLDFHDGDVPQHPLAELDFLLDGTFFGVVGEKDKGDKLVVKATVVSASRFEAVRLYAEEPSVLLRIC